MNIALIGPRGSGKSKLSAELARLTGLQTLSTDAMAVKAKEMPITEQVEKWGWQSFRELEYQLLESLANTDNTIIDCGGGILFDINENGDEIFSSRKSELLKKIAKIVYLVRPEAYTSETIINDPTRPDLNADRSYRDILSFRLPWYEKMADYTLVVSDMTPREAADKILSDIIKK